jgi:hypothetical protein
MLNYLGTSYNVELFGNNPTNQRQFVALGACEKMTELLCKYVTCDDYRQCEQNACNIVRAIHALAHCAPQHAELLGQAGASVVATAGVSAIFQLLCLVHR